MQQNEQQHKPSSMDMWQEMQIMASRRGGGGGMTPGANPLDQLRDSIGLLKDMGVSVGESSGDPDGFGPLIEKLTPLIGAVQREQSTLPPMQQQPPAQQQAPVQPEPVTVPEHMRRPNPIEPTIDPVEYGIKTLCSMAATGLDTTSAVDLIFQQLHEEQVYNLVVDDNSLYVISAMNPDVEKHLEWFADLIEMLRSELDLKRKY